MLDAATSIPISLVPRSQVNTDSLKHQIRVDLATEKEFLQSSITHAKEIPDDTAATKAEFRFLSVGEVLQRVGPIEWTIEGVMESGALSLLFGDPGSYKSFLALDWALTIATGSQWNGRKVKQGPVFIFIGEGHNGYGRRAKAWMKRTGRYLSDSPVFISDTPVQLLDQKSAEAAAKAINALQEKHGLPALVMFDTLARNFGPGDENSTADMTRFIATLDSFIDKDITRLLVHHTGHGDKQRGRGSSALKAALDAEYHLERTGDSVILHCRKMKDAQEFPSMSFEPEIVDIGAPNRPMTSLYLKSVGRAEKPAEKLSPQMRQALSLLDLMGDGKCLRCLNEWRDFCIGEGVYTRTSFYSAVKKLEDRKIIEISGGNVSMSSLY